MSAITEYYDAVMDECERIGFPEIVVSLIQTGLISKNDVAEVMLESCVKSMVIGMPVETAARLLYKTLGLTIKTYIRLGLLSYEGDISVLSKYDEA